MDELLTALASLAVWLWKQFSTAPPETQLVVALAVGVFALIVAVRMRLAFVRWQRALGFRSPYY